MRRSLQWILLGCVVANMVGCCSSPYRRWQDYIGWNNPCPDAFRNYPPPPITTPPGPTTPAVLPPPPSIQ